MKIGVREALDIPLVHKCGAWYRSDHYRLVTDTFDRDAGPTDINGNSRNILCGLGELVRIGYERDEDCTIERTLRIGRPRSEQNNWDTSESRHDIREVQFHATVFCDSSFTVLRQAIPDAQSTEIILPDRPDLRSEGTVRIRASGGGEAEFVSYTGFERAADPDNVRLTGVQRGVEGTIARAHATPAFVNYPTTVPAFTLAEVQEQINVANQRFAQAAIRLVGTIDAGPNNQGVALPGQWLDGQFDLPEFDSLQPPPTTFRFTQPSEDAVAALPFLDNGANTIDILYTRMVDESRLVRALAFSDLINGMGDKRYSNWIMIYGATPGVLQDTVTGHEVMHILLNALHHEDGFPGSRTPTTSLFNGFQTGSSNVAGTKRMGPYPGTKDPDTLIGDDEITRMRRTAENLP